MRQALLILTATERAVFSESARTQGEHRSLAHPTGSTLLGWAASAGRYATFAKTFDIFHSGKVRFSNALPITRSGHPAYPMPQLLIEPKHERGGVKKAEKEGQDRSINKGVAKVGRPTGDGQYEPLKGYIAVNGDVVTPNLGGRLRTATSEGRAAPGQLFGYQHIEPSETTRYAATIEAEDGVLDDKQWNDLLAPFDGILRLGRASGTAYGGAYECDLRDGEGADLWPAGGVTAGATRVRVWVLSDLPLVDAFGAPCFAPTATMLGLPKDGEFCGADSAISLRRYAPWNRKLGGRDVERQVIAAGSVLTFTCREGAAAQSASDGPKGRAGLWQEAGLGRFWIAPRLLDGTDGRPVPGSPPDLGEKRARVAAQAPSAASENASVTAPMDETVVQWLSAMEKLQQTGRRP